MRLMSREGGVIAGYGPLFAKLRACRFAKQDAAPEHFSSSTSIGFSKVIHRSRHDASHILRNPEAGNTTMTRWLKLGRVPWPLPARTHLEFFPERQPNERRALACDYLSLKAAL